MQKSYQAKAPRQTKMNRQKHIDKKGEQLTAVWQKWRFSAPQTVLWFIKVWFSALTFVVEIATFAKPENVDPKTTPIPFQLLQHFFCNL